MRLTTIFEMQATLPDGSLCCPTKPVLTELPPIPPNDAPLTYPEYLNARCQFNILGNNQSINGIVSASIKCETADKTDVLMYMGSSVLAFAANFTGEHLALFMPALNLLQLVCESMQGASKSQFNANQLTFAMFELALATWLLSKCDCGRLQKCYTAGLMSHFTGVKKS